MNECACMTRSSPQWWSSHSTTPHDVLLNLQARFVIPRFEVHGIGDGLIRQLAHGFVLAPTYCSVSTQPSHPSAGRQKKRSSCMFAAATTYTSLGPLAPNHENRSVNRCHVEGSLLKCLSLIGSRSMLRSVRRELIHLLWGISDRLNGYVERVLCT